ncbi:hypothetical protein MMC07_005543 [Pseudocyphellaria aurata]|nr:hypothetical protein [Pseudocyphellaria aurata]
MSRSVAIVQCLLLLLGLQHVHAAWQPPVLRRDTMPQRRQLQCPLPDPNVDRNKLFTQICNSNRQNEFWTCFNDLAQDSQDSANNYCGHEYAIYNDCLILNGYHTDLCPKDKNNYLTCSDVTLQAYAFCFCYYELPNDVANCANIILEVRRPNNFSPVPVPTSLVPSIASSSLTAPVVPPTATTTFAFDGLSGLSGSLPTSPLFPPTSAINTPSPPSFTPPVFPPSFTPSGLPPGATPYVSGPASVINTPTPPLAPAPPSLSTSGTLTTLLSSYSATLTATYTDPSGVPVLTTFATLVTTPVTGIPVSSPDGSRTRDSICTARVTRVVRRIDL